MTHPSAPLVDIIIPTFNRAHLIETAVRTALEQSWWNLRVTVIDDASTDGTRAVLEQFFGRQNFNFIRLNRNLGTAQAKNVGILFTAGDALTFHDSDDIPHRDKVLRQVRYLGEPGIHAADCLNWSSSRRIPGEALDVGAVLIHHEIILPDGRRFEVRRDLSIVDDVFPNLQLGSGVPGEWTHVNSGLFRAELFDRQGGFADCIEEDREFRNRLVLGGEIVRVLPEILLTKIETSDSLTQSVVSDYESDTRSADRQKVWDKVEAWRKTGRIDPEPVHIPYMDIGFVSNPQLLHLRDILSTSATRRAAERIFSGFTSPGGLVAAQ